MWGASQRGGGDGWTVLKASLGETARPSLSVRTFVHRSSEAGKAGSCCGSKPPRISVSSFSRGLFLTSMGPPWVGCSSSLAPLPSGTQGEEQPLCGGGKGHIGKHRLTLDLLSGGDPSPLLTFHCLKPLTCLPELSRMVRYSPPAGRGSRERITKHSPPGVARGEGWQWGPVWPARGRPERLSGGFRGEMPDGLASLKRLYMPCSSESCAVNCYPFTNHVCSLNSPSYSVGENVN